MRIERRYAFWVLVRALAVLVVADWVDEIVKDWLGYYDLRYLEARVDALDDAVYVGDGGDA